MSAASDITRRAKSNLAIALKLLPRDRRQDMEVFYAFCRTIDDIADDAGLALEERQHRLDEWQQGLTKGFAAAGALQREVIAMRDRRNIANELLVAVIDGCRMDLLPRRYETWEELAEYVWKVACAVGLVSAKIFGCTDPRSEQYAVALGNALQLTNILRDVGEDLGNGGRIYLPLADLRDAGCSVDDLTGRRHGPGFLKLMHREADRADGFFREAAAALPPADRRALLPALAMADIYQVLLRKMRADGFRVFEKRYRISRPRKLAILCKHLIAQAVRLR